MSSFRCEYCPKEYKHNFSLRNHVKNSHPGLDLPPCRPHTIRKPSSEKSGMTATWLCNCCHKQFTCRSSLCSHIKRYHQDQPMPGFLRRSRKAEFGGLTGTAEVGYSCEYCRKRYLLNYNLRRHIRTSHTDEQLPDDRRSLRYKQTCSQKIDLKFNSIEG